MFLIDVSKSMSKTRTVDLPDGPNGEQRTTEMTNLEWSIQFVLLKIQEMVSNITESLQKVSRLKPVASKIFHGRKTEQCGVILFGTEETHNLINEANGGYDHVTEYIPIAQPNVNTLTKLQQLRPSEDCVGDRKLSSEIQNNSCLKLISKLLMQSLLALRRRTNIS